MTPEELEAIKARAEAATPGPWFYDPDNDVRTEAGSIYETHGAFGRYKTDCLTSGNGSYFNHSDGEFIAHARQDVPALVAEVEKLRGEVDRLSHALGLFAVQPMGTWTHMDSLIMIARKTLDGAP